MSTKAETRDEARALAQALSFLAESLKHYGGTDLISVQGLQSILWDQVERANRVFLALDRDDDADPTPRPPLHMVREDAPA